MIDRDVTAGLGRRFLAFLIDGSMVTAAGAAVAYQQSQAFDIVGRDANGDPLIDPADFDRYEPLLDFEILGRTGVFDVPFVRSQEIGDVTRVFGADSYLGGALGLLIASLVLFCLVPSVLGRTIGMLPFGIGIRKLDGTRAGVGPNLVRAMFGFIDVLPVVLPGALGFLLASRSARRQRLGGSLSGTAVVSLKALASFDDSPPISLDLRTGEHVESDLPDGIEIEGVEPVEPVIDLDAEPADEQHVEPAVAQPASADTVADEPTLQPAETSPATASPAARVAEATAPSMRSTDQRSRPAPTETPAPQQPQPQPAAQDPAAPPIARPTIGDPLPPPPVHRAAPTSRPLGTHGPLADDHHPLLDDEPAPTTDLASTVDAPTGRVDTAPMEKLPLDLDDLEQPPAEVEVPTDTWEPPREEPAPVWQPTPFETAPVAAPDPHDGRAIDDVLALEPSVGAMLSDSPDESTSSRPGKHSASTGSARTPVWSDKWRAWMYWDTKQRCWLRHDTEANRWVPVD